MLGYFNIYCHSLHYIIITTNDDRAHLLTLMLHVFPIRLKCVRVFSHKYFFFLFMILPLRRDNDEFLVALIRAIPKCKIAARIRICLIALNACNFDRSDKYLCAT